MSNLPESQDFDFDPLSSTTVTLSQAEVDWAVQVSLAAGDITQQWQGFLRALAIRGFQQWVEAGALDLAVYYAPDRVPPQGLNCRIGDFRLCLIAQGSLSDDVVPIPRVTLESAREFAHLYVLIEVQEEVNQVKIISGLRRDHLLTHQQTARLALMNDDTYAVPVRHFDTSPEDLLLYLTHLNPERLAASVSPTPASTPSVTTGTERIANLGREVINVGRWLQGQLDDVASRLAWTLLPPLTPSLPALGFRSPEAEMDDILTDVATVVAVPDTARGACLDCQPLGLPFRFYAFTWTLFESEQPEWSLLIILGPGSGSPLPPGLRLMIRDRTTLLVDQALAPDSDATYLYGQVIGTWDEPFRVSVELSNGAILHQQVFTLTAEGE